MAYATKFDDTKFLSAGLVDYDSFEFVDCKLDSHSVEYPAHFDLFSFDLGYKKSI